MKSLIVRQNGRMETIERPLPALQPGKIRVKTSFAGVGFADMMAVRGGYPLAPKKPFSPGYEFAGLVESLGTAVCHLKPGQAVAGMLPAMDCYQEYLDIDPAWAVGIPEGLDLQTAALMPLNYLTAMALLEKKTSLQPGQSFLIHGAAGGVGSAVLELARLKGLRAFGTANAAKHDDLRALGASPLELRPGWERELRKLIPEGVDAAFDSFGGEVLQNSYRCLAKGGPMVSYGFSPTVDGGSGPMIRGLLFHLRMRLVPDGRRTAICGTPGIIARDRDWYRQTLTICFEQARLGQLSPRLFEVFPWQAAAEAHRAIGERRVRGKMLLEF